MSTADSLLDIIEEGITAHGGDLGGWTRRDGDALQLFDGRVTLRAKVDEQDAERPGFVHSHVLATLPEYEDETLDACVIGFGEDEEQGVRDAAMIWIMCVAGPIRSFLDDKPSCMTCRADCKEGDPDHGYSRGDYGLPGLRAYVGPAMTRGFEDGAQPEMNDAKPWFRYAAESAAPRRVHIAKSTVSFGEDDGWTRKLEIDGHDVFHNDPAWPGGPCAAKFGYATRFAVFEFPNDDDFMNDRVEIDRAIRYFAERYGKHESVDALMDEMIGKGYPADLVKEVESISTIAFGRALFEHTGVVYSPYVIRARRDGRVEMNVPLMSIPTYSRARAIAERLRTSLSEEEFQNLGSYNAESHLIYQVLEQSKGEVDFSKMKLYPCVAPENGVSDATMDAAVAKLNELVEANKAKGKRPAPAANVPSKKPWWKFW